MADFHQGNVTTFHRITAFDGERSNKELIDFGRHMPIALVLPVTPTEVGSPALDNILSQLKDVPYLKEIVIPVGRTSKEDDFLRAKEVFSVLPQRHYVFWASGPQVKKFLDILDDKDLSAGADGKGRSAWLSYGFILAREQSKVIALHDCDIVNYSPEMLARLVYPVVSTSTDYAFCKGYYARVTDRMHGRVTRLFVNPLVKSLIKLFGPIPFLLYLSSFRYPLSGEFSMITELAKLNRIPSDWGLEVETLAEVYRNYSQRRICQAEICQTYEHKHQPLSPGNIEAGLMKMAVDIAKSIFRNLAIESIILSDSALRTLVLNYMRTAQDEVKRYSDDAAFNGLSFDYHQEAVTIEAFTQAVQTAGLDFLKDPLYSPLIPSWNRVISALPDCLDDIRSVVEEENR